MPKPHTEVTVSVLPPCDIHQNDQVLAEYDAKSVMGPWAYMCKECFAVYGVGLGMGRGQRLVLDTTQEGKK